MEQVIIKSAFYGAHAGQIFQLSVAAFWIGIAGLAWCGWQGFKIAFGGDEDEG